MFEWVKKITDIIMPIEPIPGEEEEVDEKKTEAKTAEAKPAAAVVDSNMRRTATGSGTSYTAGTNNTATMNGVNYTAYTDTSRPHLKIIKAPEFVMKLYKPADYSQTNGIADDVLAHKAVIVNYEYVHNEEQRRICNYIDGVCYAVDGAVTKITEKIFLYTPAGISSSDIAALVASVRYH